MRGLLLLIVLGTLSSSVFAQELQLRTNEIETVADVAYADTD
jgi:hypothetical protein